MLNSGAPASFLICSCCCAQAARLEQEAIDAKAVADAAEENAATSALPPRIVALCPVIKKEVVDVKQEEKFDFGPEVDRLSVSRGHSRQSKLNSRGSTRRPLTGTGSRPGSRSALHSRGSSQATSTDADQENNEGADNLQLPEVCFYMLQSSSLHALAHARRMADCQVHAMSLITTNLCA